MKIRKNRDLAAGLSDNEIRSVAGGKIYITKKAEIDAKNAGEEASNALRDQYNKQLSDLVAQRQAELNILKAQYEAQHYGN